MIFCTPHTCKACWSIKLQHLVIPPIVPSLSVDHSVVTNGLLGRLLKKGHEKASIRSRLRSWDLEVRIAEAI